MTESQDLRTALEQLLKPVKDTAAYTAQLVKHVGTRLDVMSLDIARDAGAIAGGNHAAAGKELAELGFAADDPDQLVDLTASLITALRPGTQTSELDWQAAFADQIAQAKQLGGLTIPRSFVLLGRVLASIAGLLATYKPKLEIHPLIARHLAAAIA
jgi:hypothetical protein